MKRFDARRLVLTIAVIASALACSDDSDAPSGGASLDASSARDATVSSDAGPGTEVGVLLGPISGVAYETDTQRGVTDAMGRFAYAPGELVDFQLGSVEIGGVEGKAEVSLFDLVPTSRPIALAPRIDDALESNNSSFRRLLNLAVFIFSLDADDDPSNGIDIEAPVAALFQDVEIDFSLPLRTVASRYGRPRPGFPDQFPLRSRLGRANAERLFTVPHGTINYARALQFLYASVSFDAMMFGPVVTSIDNDIDGDVDQEWSYTYDDQGRLIRSQKVSGARTDIETYVYDRNWNLLERARAINDNDPIVTRWTYDDSGRRTSRIESQTSTTEAEFWEYDQSGSLIHYERDEDGDGDLDYAEDRSYDDLGRIVEWQIDAGADGGVNSIVSYTYDDEMNTRRLERDADASGPENNYVEMETYDGRDRLIERILDRDSSDGIIDEVTTLTWDDADASVREERDDLADGTIDFIEALTFDLDGNEIFRETDEDADSVADTTSARSYDEEGRLILVEADFDGDGDVDSRTRLVYDSRGNLLQFERDNPVGDNLERQELSQYDQNDNQVSWERNIAERGLGRVRFERSFVEGGWLYGDQRFDEIRITFF